MCSYMLLQYLELNTVTTSGQHRLATKGPNQAEQVQLWTSKQHVFVMQRTNLLRTII